MKIIFLVLLFLSAYSVSFAQERSKLKEVKLCLDSIQLGTQSMNRAVEQVEQGKPQGMKWSATAAAPELIVDVALIAKYSKGKTTYKEVQLAIRNPDEAERGCKAMKVLFESEGGGVWTAYLDKFDYDNNCTPTASYKDEHDRGKIIAENVRNNMKKDQANKPLMQCYNDCMLISGNNNYQICKQNCNMKFKY